MVVKASGRRPPLLLIWGKGLNQINHYLPGNLHLHLRQELLAFGSLLGRGLLVITKTKLLSAHNPSTGPDYKNILPQIVRVFQRTLEG